MEGTRSKGRGPGDWDWATAAVVVVIYIYFAWQRKKLGIRDMILIFQRKL